MTVRPKTSTLRLVASAFMAVLVCVATLTAPSTARAADSIFTVSGRGWGHGIGMTQYGAMGYAQQGKTYDWILAHYFQQTTLATRVELTVKVDIDSGKDARSAWRISAGSSDATLTVSDYSAGAPSFDVTQGASVWVGFSGGDTVIRADRIDSGGSHTAGSVVATFSGSALVSTASAKDSLVRFWGETGPFNERGIAWRGRIRFTPETTTGHAINYVPMEQYLRGVVPRESPSSWPTEALRAQAVAARSYAYDSAAAGDVLWCTTMSQVYAGANCVTDGHVHETARTDSAITATANKFVVYGSKVIKTFFSSSSGGRTANSKDVWFSSASDNDSPVYYTSVTDADDVDSNPNYRWTLADMTGSTLAGKIRSHYPGDAHASPSTVKKVTLDAGASGFIRYVTLTWSQGAATKLTGPQFQHALGLKSSAFSVKLKNPPPPPETRFQQADARPLWTGSFTGFTSASASGGSYRRMSGAGSSVTVTFKGTSVSWIGIKGSRAGKADVSLDGTRVATIDSYDSSAHYKVALWTRTGLAADTTHTLVITTLGTKRSASGGTYVYVDAFDVLGTLVTTPRPPVWNRFQQNSSAVAYSGAWKSSTLPGLSGGTHAYSHETSAAAVFTFTGTRARWIGKRAANYGKAWVSVDGAPPVLVDLYSATTKNQQRLFESALLAAGTHTMTIRVAGTMNVKATYHYVDVDAFEALQPAP